MKKIYIQTVIVCAFIICIFCTNEAAHSQGFNSVTSPDGVNIIAVGKSGKYYRSANGGQTYSSYTFGSAKMNSVTSFGNDVWIACDNGSVYKTLKTNYAVNSYSTGTANSLNSVYFRTSSDGYVCGDGGVIFKTNDGGQTWSSINSGIPSLKLNSISFRDASNGIVAGNGGSIYATVDGGASWNLQSSGTTKNLLKIKFFTDSIAAVGEYGALLLNKGAGWTSVNTRIRTDIRGVAGKTFDEIHVAGGGGFIRNNKLGSDNFLNFEQNPMMANISDIFFYDKNKGWAVSSLNNVIIYTSNAGATWSMPAGSSISYAWVTKLIASGGIGNNLCEHPTDRNTMFVVYGSTVYVSRDRCETWTNIATIAGGGSAHSFYVSPVDTNVWMVAITGSPDKVKRSTNYGATWTNILSLNFSNYGQPLEMDQNNPNNYYFAPDGGGFYRSTDNGASFAEISGNFPFTSPCDLIVSWDSSDVMYVADGVTGSGLGKIYKSNNNGVNWTLVHTNSSSSEIPSMCNTVFDRNQTYATNWGGGQLYKTTNHGTNWFLLSTQSTSGWGSDISHEDPTLVLKGTYGSPTWLSTNSGATFTSTIVGNGAGAGIIVPERGYMISMQTAGLLKMSIVYTDSVINQSPKFLNEDFTNAFPPDDWDFDLTGTNNFWIYSPVSSYGSGTGSAEFYNYDAPAGTNQSFITPTLFSTVSGDTLTFDQAYAPSSPSVTDSLIIETSVNNGSSYTTLVRLYGRGSATGANVLNTAPTTNQVFTPNSGQWVTRKYGLPAGTNKIKFRARSGSGNNLYLDKIRIGKYAQVNVKVAIQGLYNGWTHNVRDTLKAYLRNAVSPFGKIDSATAVIDSLTLNAPFTFTNASSGTYYIQLIHRNGLETWSKNGGEVVTNGVTSSYDFTNLQSQSYGSNTLLTGSKWCLYSGDVNSDGAIDISDVIEIYNDAVNFESGYLVTDLNGDETVDVTDLLLCYNNSSNFISKVTPETLAQDIKNKKDIMKAMFNDYRQQNLKALIEKKTVK